MIEWNAYRWLKIEPVDAWFFRDGRPSNRGEDQSDLVSEFPPNPATVVGAIRAVLARQHGWSGQGSWASNETIKAVLGDGFDDLGQFKVLGPFLMDGQDVLWPMPRHVVGRNADGFSPSGLLQPSAEPMLCDAGEIRLPQGVSPEPKPPEPPTGVFVTSKGLSQILKGQMPDDGDCRVRTQLFQHESRVGILREADTRTTGPNAMYSPRYVRLQRDVSLTVGIAGIPGDWQLPSVFALGGESRMAGVETLERAPEIPSGTGSGKYRLLINVTPALFADRWWGAGPKDDATNLSSDLSGTVATVMLDRPQRIGGWNSVDGCPLALRPFVPPGTVWWIESTELAESRLVQIGQSSAYGYGLTLVSGHDGK